MFCSQKTLLLFCLIPLLLFTKSFSQEATTDSSAAPPLITAIFIDGNDRTKEHIILREMKARVGVRVDREMLEGDQKRILNLGLFNRVDIQGLPTDDGVQLLVLVDERWNLWPYPIFFVNDKDWDKLSYGAGLLYFNFRGRNETISASGWGGYNPALQLDYANPWIFGKHHLFGRWRFYTERVQNRFFKGLGQEVDEKRIGGSFTLGKRFGYFTYVSALMGYSQLRFDPAVPCQNPDSCQTLNLSGRDVLPTLGLTYLYDARDLHEYPLAGSYIRLSARRVGFGSENIHYMRYSLDARHYEKLHRRLTLAARIMTEVGQDRIPLYDLVYLGYQHRVRGHFFEDSSGRNLALGSVELRVPLVPLRYFSAANMPIIKDILPEMLLTMGRNTKFGMNLAVFADFGLVWSEEKFPELANGWRGYGVGLHFHAPLVNVLRLELAWNKAGKMQRIVDLGVAF
ncbi:MAG: BamA/TamA family outer membrane protein [candidate division KSB1 bacterium]